MKGIFFHIGLLLLVTAAAASAQPAGYVISARNAESVVTEDGLRARVEFLTDTLCTGRATGTPGATWAKAGIARQFAGSGLLPSRGGYFHGFRTMNGKPAHNIVGFLPGTGDRYIVIASHFDNIGTLQGTLYPGADSNASGVAVLSTLARMFQHLKDLGKTYSHTLIFVALDAKEQSLGGSHHLWNEIAGGLLTDPRNGHVISPKEIDRMVNIDQVGGTEAPLHPSRPDYLIMLSDAGTGRRDALLIANMDSGIGLDLGFDYYGSKDFTRVFYRTISDQKPFLDHGIPSVMFTSGITLRNNKADDDAASLDYGILRRRVLAIFHYLVRVI
ncbi:MAG: M28 family peptidase [Bacteroidales bacterium]|nr:M28 family peptidase [Bacteroidales bacterium]